MTNNEPRGVGGWLLLFCVGQVLIAPLRTLQTIWRMQEQIGPHPFPVIRQLVTIIIAIGIGLTVYGMIVGILIWKGNKRGQALARHYLLIRIGITVIIFGSLTAWSFNTLGTPAAQRMAMAMISPVSLEIAWGLIWFAYFTYSKRVRNTYCATSES
jgi:hypothetical protein